MTKTKAETSNSTKNSIRKTATEKILKSTGSKIFVLDTNILIQTLGRAIFGFADNCVVVTHTTIEELDGLKNAAGETGYNARQAIRVIESIKEGGKKNYSTGYPINSGGVFRIETNNLEAALPKGWSLDKPDNRIICTTKSLSEKNHGKAFLITNDVSMRIKADVAGIEAQGYHNEQIDTDDDFTGKCELVVDSGEGLVNMLYRNKDVQWDFTGEGKDLPENTYITLREGQQSALCKKCDGRLKLLRELPDKGIYGVKPKSANQRFALDALMSPVEDIPLVILKGPAGCGKTYMALAAALEQVNDDRSNRKYDQIIITRSNTLSDEDMGFLPGGIEEKMDPLLAPFYDNLRVLLKMGSNEDMEQIEIQLNDLMVNGTIKIAPISYIRGRSIQNSFIIVDEAQNLSVTQAKTIITRAGLNTRVVMLGDPDQIDSPKLSKKSNGLVYVAEEMKGSKLAAQITFTEQKDCVRSPLASDAIMRL